MTDLLIVSGEALWPAVHGGRIRAAGMAEALAGRFSVRVAAPVEGGVPTGVDIGVDALPDEDPVPRLVAVASPQPRLGRALLGPRRSRALLQAVADHRPRAVLFVNGYLAAAAPSIDRPTFVDFHDVEVRRSRSLAAAGSGGRRRARAAAALESVKAQWWEPVEARRSAAVSATTADDVALLASWGARAVLVGHGSSASSLPASPGDGPVTLLAGFGYGPNRAAARWVLDEVWPRLRAAAGPGLRLRIVGRGAEAAAGTLAPEGVEVVGDPDDIEPFYREASVVLAPVTAGGGAQVKVTEALARARVVVATPFSARSAPDGAGEGLVVAGDADRFAAAVLALWRDREDRWARERGLAERSPVPTWAVAFAPLAHAIEQVLRAPVAP